MRSVWKGSISFGLVYIPVAVYPATREEKVSFKQLRRSDLSAIRYKKVAEADEMEVPATDIVKGYEYEKGKWVVLEDADFEQVQIESTKAIEITEFVAAEINPKYFYKPYFLEAQKGGEKGYALLPRALAETGRIGIAKVAIRSREYLAAVRTEGLFLMLELMHFAQEVLSPEGELKTPAGLELSGKEIEMAKALVESLAAEFEPEKYADRYQDAVREMIERKIKKLPAKPSAPRREAGVVDLLAVLQESLAQNADKRKKPAKSGGSREASPRVTRSLAKQRRKSGALGPN